MPIFAAHFEPSASSPFSAAYVRVLSAMPSLDGRISELHKPKLLWAWGVSYEPYVFSEYVPPQGWDGCYRRTVSAHAAGPPVFVGAHTFSISGKSANSSAAGRLSEVPADLWQNLAVEKGENGAPILPQLEFAVTGVVQMPYSVTRRVCRMSIQSQPGGMSEGCSCQENSGTEIFSTPEISHSKNWSVELGAPHAIMLVPPAGEQLSISPRIGALVFSSHKAAQISILSDGGELNSTYFDVFSVQKGELGATAVASSESNTIGANLSTAPSAGQSGAHSPTKSNFSISFSNPSLLDEKNRSFAYQYYISTSSPLPSGTSNVRLYFRNEFDDEDYFGWDFLVRDASFIAQNQDGAAMAKVAKPAASPQMPEDDFASMQISLKSAPAEISGDGESFETVAFAGNSSARPAISFLQKTGGLAQIQTNFPAAIFAFLGALWLFRAAR